MAKVGSVLFEIKDLLGLNTNSPRGLALQPFECVNVRFDRSGGYAAQPDSKKLSGALNLKGAWWAGLSNELFVQTDTDVQYYNGSFTAITGTTGATIGSKTTLALTPGFRLVTEALVQDSFYLQRTGVTQVFREFTVAFWDGSGSAPSTPYWHYVANPTDGVFDEATETTDEMEVIVLGKGSGNTYSWWDAFTFGKGSPNPQSSASPPVTGKYDIQVSMGSPFFNNAAFLYYNLLPLARFGGTTVFVGDTGQNSGKVMVDNPYGTPDPPSQTVFPDSSYEAFFPFGSISVYHNNRVWMGLNPLTSDQYIQGVNLDPVIAGPDPEDNAFSPSRIRLYYSEVVGANTEPTWLSDYYIDPPFKVSSRVVGLASAGRYLYVFGDRELLILSGNSDADFQMESLGDSIGAVRENSIASLGGVVYWVSDSGVMAAQGGQVAEVGGDVRWTVTNMDQTKLTSTVDFSRELYFLSDQTTTLVFDAREKKWSTRTGTALGLGNYQLTYGGGTAYCLAGSSPSVLALYDESNLTANKLEARVLWGDYENGSWDLRKTLSQITFGGQVSSGTMSIKNLSKVDSMSSLTDENTLTPASVGKVSLIPVDSAGVQLSGNVMRIGFSFQPSGTNEGVVRGPIQAYGSVKGEEQR